MMLSAISAMVLGGDREPLFCSIFRSLSPPCIEVFVLEIRSEGGHGMDGMDTYITSSHR